jgi:hypothetical protein
VPIAAFSCQIVFFAFWHTGASGGIWGHTLAVGSNNINWRKRFPSCPEMPPNTLKNGWFFAKTGPREPRIQRLRDDSGAPKQDNI